MLVCIRPRIDKGILVCFTVWCLVCGWKLCSMAYVTIFQSTNFKWYAGWDHCSSKSSRWFHNAFQMKNKDWFALLVWQPQFWFVCHNHRGNSFFFNMQIINCVLKCYGLKLTKWIKTGSDIIFSYILNDGSTWNFCNSYSVYKYLWSNINFSQQVVELKPNLYIEAKSTWVIFYWVECKTLSFEKKIKIHNNAILVLIFIKTIRHSTELLKGQSKWISRYKRKWHEFLYVFTNLGYNKSNK